jgi:replicative DNA helicase
MSFLPVEDSQWLRDFKTGILLEKSIVRKLIQWGFTDAAFEIHRTIEERFDTALESFASLSSTSVFRLPDNDRIQIKEILRDHYLQTREFPRRRNRKELLQRGLLTGFEELSTELIQLYEQRLQLRARAMASKRAA